MFSSFPLNILFMLIYKHANAKNIAVCLTILQLFYDLDKFIWLEFELKCVIFSRKL